MILMIVVATTSINSGSNVDWSIIATYYNGNILWYYTYYAFKDNQKKRWISQLKWYFVYNQTRLVIIYSNDKIKKEIILIKIAIKPFQTIDKNVYQQFDVWINNMFFKGKTNKKRESGILKNKKKKRQQELKAFQPLRKNFFLGQATRFEIRTRRFRKFF